MSQPLRPTAVTLGQMKGYVYIEEDIQHPKLLNALVISGSDKVLIIWQLLMRWGVISPTFPKAMDTNKLFKVHQGVTLEDAVVQEGEAMIESVKTWKRKRARKMLRGGYLTS